MTWRCDSGRRIHAACSNSRQVVISVGGDQLIYFEFDEVSGGLLVDKGQKLFKKQQIICLDVGEIPDGR